MRKQLLAVMVAMALLTVGCGSDGSGSAGNNIAAVNQSASFYGRYAAFDPSLGEPVDDFDFRWFNKLLAPQAKIMLVSFDRFELKEFSALGLLPVISEQYVYYNKTASWPADVKLVEMEPGLYFVHYALLDQADKFLFGGGEPMTATLEPNRIYHHFNDKLLELPLNYQVSQTTIFIKNFGAEPVTQVYAVDEHDTVTSSFNTDWEKSIAPDFAVVDCPGSADRCLRLAYRFAYSNSETREPVRKKTLYWSDNSAQRVEQFSLTFKYIAEMMAAGKPIVYDCAAKSFL